ncbi:MAG: DUF559 domain-containing protein [Roseivirga sp.]|nr:DUF559 domain-containing protein [Roseivirga sp.]
MPEKRLWTYPRGRPMGFKFRRQRPFNNFILNFYCHQAKISIDINGNNHDSSQQKEQDQTRTLLIQELGIKETRFKNEQFMNQLESVIEIIEVTMRAGSLQGIQGHAEGPNQ